MQLELYINGNWERMESDKGANTLTLSHTFESVENPSSYYSDFSYPFRLPKTPRNNRLLQHVGRIDSVAATPKKYDYRLYGEYNALLSEGVATVSSVSLTEYSIQLNGSLGIAFQRLMKSGFAASDEPQYYQLPDIISYSGNGNEYSNRVILERNLVWLSWNADNTFIPFTLQDLRSVYRLLSNIYLYNIINGGWGYSNITGITDSQAFVTSIIGFMPQMQGRYKNFDSKKWVTGNVITPLFGQGSEENAIDVGNGLTELQMQQYRSYYQTPFVYVQKLWEVYKEECENITGYTLNLDCRWYNEDNLMLRDCVYTLPNFGNTEKVTPNITHTVTTTATNSLTFPPNSEFDDSNYHIAGLNGNNYVMSFYSELTQVEKNDILNFTVESEITMENNFAHTDECLIYYRWYERNIDNEWRLYWDAQFAYNQANPIIAMWSVVDANYNTVYSNNRPTFIVPLLQTNDYTEELNEIFFELWNAVGDVILYYYNPDFCVANYGQEGFIEGDFSTYIMAHVAHFGSVQLAATWQNRTGAGQYRIKWQLKFLNDLLPIRMFWPQMPDDEQGGKFHYNTRNGTYCPPSSNPNAYITLLANYTAKTQTYEATRSYRHITTADVFGDVKPFTILLKYSKLNNLVWIANDQEKTLRVLRKYDYLQDCVNAGLTDITSRVNIDKDITTEVQAIHGNKVLFEFADSNDKYSREYTKKYGNSYGALTVYTQDKESSETIKAFEGDTAKFLPPIVATDITTTRKNVELRNAIKQETPYAFPSNVSDSGEFAGDSDVFYLRNDSIKIEHNAFSVYPEDLIYITDDKPQEVQSNVYCYHGDDVILTYPRTVTRLMPQYTEHTRDNNNLLWMGEPREMYYDVPQSVLDSGVSVFESEWKEWAEEAYNVGNKRVTVYCVMNNEFYKRLKHNPLIRFTNAICVIEKMEYSPENRNAKLTMRTLSALPLYNQQP